MVQDIRYCLIWSNVLHVSIFCNYPLQLLFINIIGVLGKYNTRDMANNIGVHDLLRSYAPLFHVAVILKLRYCTIL